MFSTKRDFFYFILLKYLLFYNVTICLGNSILMELPFISLCHCNFIVKLLKGSVFLRVFPVRIGWAWH